MAGINSPAGIAADGSGNIYFADRANNRVRKVNSNGVVTTAAGTGVAGFTGDTRTKTSRGTTKVVQYVAAVSSALNAPGDVAAGPNGNIYIADTANNRVRRVDTSGNIYTAAGDGTAGFAGDGGLATAAKLNHPRGVAVDSAGNLYISDTDNQRVRKVTPGGVITTLAGTGIAGFKGDGGPAANAQVNRPGDIAVDPAGNVYITDTYNNRVRMVAVSGTMSTVAGNGTAGYSGDGGTASMASLNFPYGVAVDGAGTVYIADSSNHMVRKVDASGIISATAGTTVAGSGGDGGPATAGSLDYPAGLTMDATGNLYISDGTANRIRMVEGPSYVLPTSTIKAPSMGDQLDPAKYTISGVSSAASGIAFVEVSTDGGLSWNTASGAAPFSLSWTPPSSGTYRILSRATDSIGRVEKMMSCADVTVAPDTVAPSSSIASPTQGASLTGTSVTISGTGTDGTGTGVSSVEVSTNGGATWVTASGKESWSYNWTLPAAGSYVLKCRATDNSGNTEIAGAGVTVTVPAAVTPVTVSQPSPGTPTATAGATVTWTAAASGGTGSYQYQFMRKGPDTGTGFVLARDWSASGSWAWATTVAMAGANYVTVNVRNSDLSGQLASSTYSGYTVNTPAQTGQATLAWDASPTAATAGYKIHIGTTPGVYTQTVDAGKVTSYTATNLAYGTTYYFATTAYDPSGNVSGYSNEVSRTVQQPTTLAWDPSATQGVTGYKVYYGTAPGTYTQNVDVANITAYSFKDLTYGATYYFTVSAYDASGSVSSYSNEVSKTVM